MALVVMECVADDLSHGHPEGNALLEGLLVMVRKCLFQLVIFVTAYRKETLCRILDYPSLGD